jgi:hypothetical protein
MITAELLLWSRDVGSEVRRFLDCTDLLTLSSVCRSANTSTFVRHIRGGFVTPPRENSDWPRHLCSITIYRHMWPQQCWERLFDGMTRPTSLSVARCNVPLTLLNRLPPSLQSLCIDRTAPLCDMLSVHDVEKEICTGMSRMINLRAFSIASNELILTRRAMQAILGHSKLVDIQVQGNYSFDTGNCTVNGGLRMLGITYSDDQDSAFKIVSTLPCPLRSLYVSCEFHLSTPIMEMLTTRARRHLTPHLQELKIMGGVLFGQSSWSSSMRMMETIMNMTPNLLHLDLRKCVIAPQMVHLIFMHASPSLEILRLGMCLPELTAHPTSCGSSKPRRLRELSLMWNSVGYCIDMVTGLHSIDVSFIGQRVTPVSFSSIVMNNATTLESLVMDHVLLQPEDSAELARVIATKCRRLKTLHMRGWEDDREFLRNLPNVPPSIEDWVMGPSIQDFPQWYQRLSECTMLRRMEIRCRFTFTFTIPERCFQNVLCWDFSSSGVTSEDVHSMTLALSNDACPRLREWILDDNLTIYDDAWYGFRRAWALRSQPLRSCFRVMSVQFTNVTVEGFEDLMEALVYGGCHMRRIQGLDTSNPHGGLDMVLLRLLHNYSIDGNRLPQEIGFPKLLVVTIDPIIRSMLESKGCLVCACDYD